MKMIGKLFLAAILTISPALIVTILAIIGTVSQSVYFWVFQANVIIAFMWIILIHSRRSWKWTKKFLDFISTN